MAQLGHSTVQERSFTEWLAECAREARRQARLLPQGALRDALLDKARAYDAQIAATTFETKH